MLRNQADAQTLSTSLTLMAIELVHEAVKPSRVHHPVRRRDGTAQPTAPHVDDRPLAEAPKLFAADVNVTVDL